jgi:hypothetical protein
VCETHGGVAIRPAGRPETLRGRFRGSDLAAELERSRRADRAS